MTWQEDLLARLEDQPICGYGDEATAAALDVLEHEGVYAAGTQDEAIEL